LSLIRLHRTWLRCKNSARLCPLTVALFRIIASFFCMDAVLPQITPCFHILIAP
jgi:hypothetical protein